jgi:hypothetical protein
MLFSGGNRKKRAVCGLMLAASTCDLLDGRVFQIGNMRKQQLPVKYET